MQALLPTGTSVALSAVRDPEPLPHQAVVAVQAFALNRADALYLDAGADWRVGIDAAGLIVTPAADGSSPPAGQRVVLHIPTGGAGAELVAVDSCRLAELPAEVDTATAAALPLAGLVALRLIRLAEPLEGRRVLITGATGGVGQFAVQLAAAHGAHVTALVRDKEDAGHLVRMGATVVRDVTNATGRFDVLLESVGGLTAKQAIMRLGPGGLVLWFGQASGEPVTLDFFELLNGCPSLTLRHFVYSDLSDADDAHDLTELVALAANGTLTPEIGLLEPWTATNSALEAIRGGRQVGKAVLTITPERNDHD
jgi:NADPH:quinone reductase-like Zn-dependent oxidoreductase